MARLLFREETTTDTGIVVTEKFDDGTVWVDGEALCDYVPEPVEEPVKEPAKKARKLPAPAKTETA